MMVAKSMLSKLRVLPSMSFPSLNSRAVVIPGSQRVIALVLLANSSNTGLIKGKPKAPMYRTSMPRASMAFAMIGPFPPSFSKRGKSSIFALLPAAAEILAPISAIVETASN